MFRSINAAVRAPHAIAFACLLFLASSGAHAQLSPTAPRAFIEELRQQERERALREQQERSVDTRRPAEAQTAYPRLNAQETPCFRIDRLRLVGEHADDFQWALGAASGPANDDSPIGQCLGTQGVNTVLARVQQALIAHGWVTTRALAAPQDLGSGELLITLVPGRIAAIRFADEATATNASTTALRNAIPAAPGDLLNLRDIEQALENLKRLPTAEADIRIEPSRAADTQPDVRPGDSDLIVQYARRTPLRATLSLDDSGTKATGVTQAGATVAWDGPLGLNDLFYVSLNHDAFNHQGSGTAGQTVHYSIPWGYWLLGATASRSNYHQSVAGFDQHYVYAGKTRNAEVRLSRLVYRDARRKTSLSLRAFRRASHNFVDDTEIEVQRRIVGGWEVGLNHKEFIGDATLEGTLAWRRGTGAFGAIEAPEAPFGEGTSHFGLATAEFNANLPFKLGDQSLRYAGLWRAQWNATPLTPLDRFAIGGRYTVRGFDGENSLLGDRGWLIRNDIGWSLGQSGAELYLGLDYGQVGGRSTWQLLGAHLAGGAIGVRGAVQVAGGQLGYDLFVGAPISKPVGFQAPKVIGGLNLNISF